MELLLARSLFCQVLLMIIILSPGRILMFCSLPDGGVRMVSLVEAYTISTSLFSINISLSLNPLPLY